MASIERADLTGAATETKFVSASVHIDSEFILGRSEP
jgi:hypothetical protein